ncbi:MAG TPA: ricin-type beta-trefoil lectin domain protein [Kribbella sp.]|nr:ricin-type beta-trefoil lectin domain protein [Kribbella sp.]
MIIRRLLSRTGVAVLAVSVALATAVPAQAAVPAPEPVAVSQPGVEVGVAKQIASRADTRYCLTFVAAEKVPMGVMMACAPGKEGRTQQWVYTESGQLQVAMSKSVGGALAETGACLDTGADLVKTPADAPVLVLPCREGDGQTWTYDEADGTFVNAANGLALSSLMGKGKSKQAQPTGIQSAAGSPTQGWSALPLPGLDILGAVLALVNALLASLGLALPLPIAKAASSLLELVRGKTPVPSQISVLPKQMMQLAQR